MYMNVFPGVSSRHAFASLLLVALTVSGCVDSRRISATADSQYWQDCETCPQLVRIEPGAFRMGSADDETIVGNVPRERILEERPAHDVRIAYPFAIGRYELTVAQFSEFADATGYQTAGCFVLRGTAWEFKPDASWRAPGFPVDDNYPATCLSSNDFSAYLQWLSRKTGHQYRIPTEAEWEYVARLGQGDVPTPELLGATACERVNGADAAFGRTYAAQWKPGLFDCDYGYAAAAPVGSFQPNKLGMYDVLGNLSEWTQDCAGGTHAGAPSDGSVHIVETCTSHVLKGGSWSGGPGFLRPAIRGGFPIELRGDGHGLRVLRELQR